MTTECLFTLSGYIFPEPGGPILRRPPPGALGSFPPPGALPPGALPPRGFPLGPPHPLDMAGGWLMIILRTENWFNMKAKYVDLLCMC